MPMYIDVQPRNLRDPQTTSTDEWWATRRDRNVNRSPRVPDLVRARPLAALVYLMPLCGGGVAVCEEGLRPLFAVPLGALIGAALWWLLLTAFAKGWIEEE
jgi:hypothetical protein